MKNNFQSKAFYIILSVIFAVAVNFQIRFCNLVVFSLIPISLYKNYKSKTLTDFFDRIIKLKYIDKKIKKQIYELLLLSVFVIFSSPEWKFSLKSILTVLTYLISISIILQEDFKFLKNKEIIVKSFFISYFLVVLSVIILKVGFNKNIFLSGKSIGISVSIFWLFLLYILNNSKLNFIKNFSLSVIYYLLIFCLIFLHHSATTKVSILATPIIFLFVKILDKKLILRGLQFFIIVLFLAFPIIFYKIDLDKFFFKYKNIEPSFKHRMCILKYSIDKFIENPISGNGFKASRFYNTDKVCFILTKEEGINLIKRDGKEIKNENEIKDANVLYNAGFHPHNFIVQILFELGIFGAISIILITRNISEKINNKHLEDKTSLAIYFSIFGSFFCLYIFSYSLWESWLLGFISFFLLAMKLIKNRNYVLNK